MCCFLSVKCHLLLYLDIDSFEGGVSAKATEGVVVGSGTDDQVLVVNLALETIATLVDVVVCETVALKHGRAIGTTLAFGYVARRVANSKMNFILAGSMERYVTAHIVAIAVVPLFVAVMLKVTMSITKRSGCRYELDWHAEIPGGQTIRGCKKHHDNTYRNACL